MIPRMRFGRTGHDSSRLIFGAAALYIANQDQADETLQLLLDQGINHIDVAASYGAAEDRVGPWMAKHRNDFFLATKTGDRSYDDAKASIERSLERLRVEQLDLIQLHNLVNPEDWETAMGPDGALRAAREAREAGLVRFIGVTGHGTRVAGMHLKSLERFDFDTVLLPYNFTMMEQPEYAQDFEALLQVCADRDVPVQTIKSIARRRWPEDMKRTHTTWYQPLEEQKHIDTAVHWALSREQVFVNTSSDTRLLRCMIDAAHRFESAPDEARIRADIQSEEISALFVRGYDGI